MFSIAIIIFREILEISLIVGVLLAATRGLAGRSKWVWGGLGAGVLGAAMIAYFAEAISQAAEGMGQEIFNACILFLAAILIGWTVVWMRRFGRNLTQHFKDVGSAVIKGERPMYTLGIVIALALLREGSEIVLFTYSALVSGEPVIKILLGASLGAIAGTGVGVALYYGMIAISTRTLFSVTTWLLIFLAAGMVSQAVGFLQNGGFVPVMATQVWDTSYILPESSLVGNMLHVLVGYSSRPTGIQLISYILTLVSISAFLKFYGNPALASARK